MLVPSLGARGHDLPDIDDQSEGNEERVVASQCFRFVLVIFTFHPGPVLDTSTSEDLAVEMSLCARSHNIARACCAVTVKQIEQSKTFIFGTDRKASHHS